VSESILNVSYLAVALVELVNTVWKILVLRRDPTPALILTVPCLLFSVATFVLATPVVYRALGDASGQPNLPTLVVDVSIVLAFALCHVLSMLWNPQHRDDLKALRRRIIRWSGIYGLGVLLMLALFLAADIPGPSHPIDFNVTYGHDPLIFSWLMVFLFCHGCGIVGTYLQCRNVRTDDRRLNRSVRQFGRAMIFIFGFIICMALAILANFMGSHSLDWLAMVADGTGSIGAVIAGYALTGAAVGEWRQELRDVKALQPLWNLVAAGTGHMPPNSNRLMGGAGRRLMQRVIDIRDGTRRLRPWMSERPAQAVEALTSTMGSPGMDLKAVQAAATLLDATARLNAARAAWRAQGHQGEPPPPGAPEVVLPGEDTAQPDERGHLVRVAKALSLPIVEAALITADYAVAPVADRQGP